MDAAHHT
jgi:hypothetical protein